jgi:hypothetical protein
VVLEFSVKAHWADFWPTGFSGTTCGWLDIAWFHFRPLKLGYLRFHIVPHPEWCIKTKKKRIQTPNKSIYFTYAIAAL